MATEDETIAAQRAELQADPLTTSVNVDGQQIAGDPGAAETLLRRWQRAIGRRTGTRPTAARIKIHGL